MYLPALQGPRRYRIFIPLHVGEEVVPGAQPYVAAHHGVDILGYDIEVLAGSVMSTSTTCPRRRAKSNVM